MSLINVDTNKLRKDSKTLLSLNTKYVEYIDNIKTLLTKKDYWSGSDGDDFRSDLKETVLVYDEVGSILKQYAIFLENYSNNIDNEVNIDIIK